MENEWKIVIICKPEDTEIEQNSCFCLKPIKKAFFCKTDKKSVLCSKPIEKAVFA